jgi:hypothetical protein
LLLLLVSLLNIAVFSTVILLTFLLSDSGGPSDVDIHDVPIVPAAPVISNVNCVSAVVDHAVASLLLKASPLFLASLPTVLAVLLLLSFLLLFAMLLLWSVTLLLSSLLLLVVVAVFLLLLAYLLLLAPL